MAIVFDGRKFAQEREKKLAQQVAEFKKKTGLSPKLVSFLVDGDLASKIYLRLKEEAAKRVGIEFEKIEVSERSELLKLIAEKNKDRQVQGVLVQLPFPGSEEITNFIAPEKDVDGLTGRSKFLPAAVRAILEILTLVNWREKRICLVGAGRLVGKPLAAHLKKEGAEIIVCDENTKNISYFTRQAEILVSATGVSNLIKKEMVKPGAAVIDAGAPKGEVDFPEVKKIASFITPVPGGVGPVTIVCLLENLLQAAGLR